MALILLEGGPADGRIIEVPDPAPPEWRVPVAEVRWDWDVSSHDQLIPYSVARYIRSYQWGRYWIYRWES
jgi:hypothetical protein